MSDRLEDPAFWLAELARHDTLALDSREDRETLAGHLAAAVARRSEDACVVCGDVLMPRPTPRCEGCEADYQDGWRLEDDAG